MFRSCREDRRSLGVMRSCDLGKNVFKEEVALTIESTRESTTGTRRDFLYVATGAAAAVGTLAALFPMIDQMDPDAMHGRCL